MPSGGARKEEKMMDARVPGGREASIIPDAKPAKPTKPGAKSNQTA